MRSSKIMGVTEEIRVVVNRSMDSTSSIERCFDAFHCVNGVKMHVDDFESYRDVTEKLKILFKSRLEF
jgi:hypothetical protein